MRAYFPLDFVPLVRPSVFVYVIRNGKFWLRYKIGISNKPAVRAENISETSGGAAVTVVFCCRVFFAHSVEQALHRVFAPLHSSVARSSSGFSEYFSPVGLALIGGLLAGGMSWAKLLGQDECILIGLFSAVAVYFGWVLLVCLLIFLIRAVQEILAVALVCYVLWAGGVLAT